MALDNSKSVVVQATDSTQLKEKLNKLKETLQKAGIEVRTYTFDEANAIAFTHDITDLSLLLRKVGVDMEGRNWAATILLTDGIYNRGISPFYWHYTTPQFLVGLGDTIPPKDIIISRVRYNRIAFKGNETPLQVEITQKGFNNKEVTIMLNEGTQTLTRKKIVLTKALQEVTLLVTAKEEGLKRMTVTIPPKEEEFSHKNNHASVFMEIIEGKKNVLIVANTPHPDIKAIRSTLKTTEHYEIDIFIPSLQNEPPNKIYDVVIYHGAFSNVRYQPKGHPGLWYILNRSTSLATMNKQLHFANIIKRGSRPDKVTGAYNQNFSKFKVSENNDALKEYPPIEVPYGDYALGTNAETLLYQRVGNVTTNKPLLTFSNDGTNKHALLMGQDIWKWKLQEAAIHENTAQFDEIVAKTVQFLSIKSNKKQFTFQPRNPMFSTIENPLFDSEVYNDIYERIYGNTIQLKVTNSQGHSQNFDLVDSELHSSFKLPPLPTGIYNYQASTLVGDKTLSDKGQLSIEPIHREYLNMTADHNLLKNIATKTNGLYTHLSSIETIGNQLLSRDLKSIVRSHENLFPLIDNHWLLFTILLLFSLEWGLRKYWGGY